MRKIDEEIQTLEIDTEKRILKINGKQIEDPIVVSTPAIDGWQNSYLFNYEKMEPGQNQISAKRLVISLESNDRKEVKLLEHTTLENASTKDLVAELERREGVEKRWLEPDKETIPQVSSPTILLIITD